MPFDNNYTLNTVDVCPVGALTSKDFRFQMRAWFLKETKSVCTSCATGCNVLIGSREEKIYRYTPRDNDAVNASWMCDAGRLNYKWIGRADRLKEVLVRGQKSTWTAALNEISDKLKKAPAGSVAIIASARQTNEELWLISKLKAKLGAISDSIPRDGEADKLLVSADKNPNTNGARLTGICFTEMGINLPQDRRRHRERQNQDADCFRRELVKRASRRKLRERETISEVVTNTAHGGIAREAGHAHRQRHFAERDDRSWRITFCPAARTRKNAARSPTPKAASRNS